MKRLRRWLFNFVAAVSLVMGAAMAILWVRSYWVTDTLFISPASRVAPLFQSDQGKLLLRVGPGFGILPPSPLSQYVHLRTSPGGGPRATRGNGPVHGWLWHGFGLDWTTPADYPPGANIQALQAMSASLKQLQAPTTQQLQQISEVDRRIQQLNSERGLNWHTDIRAPAWFIVVVAWLVSGLWLYRRLMHPSGRAPGLCSNCGYDLRATPERCPECGHVMGLNA